MELFAGILFGAFLASNLGSIRRLLSLEELWVGFIKGSDMGQSLRNKFRNRDEKK